MPDPRPLALPSLSRADIPTPSGTPATRDDLRARMTWAQAHIADAWRAFDGGIAEVTAVEAGYVYRWRR